MTGKGFAGPPAGKNRPERRVSHAAKPTRRRLPKLGDLPLSFYANAPAPKPKPKPKRPRALGPLAALALIRGPVLALLSAWAIPVGAAVAVFILGAVVWALRPPRDRRDVLPPLPRRCLDNLPPADDRDGTR